MDTEVYCVVRACQGCQEAVAEDDIQVWVVVKRARMGFCCVECATLWLISKAGRQCLTCQGFGPRIRKKRRIDYWMRMTGRPFAP